MIIDSRITQLADGLTGFSTALKKGERVLIDAYDVPGGHGDRARARRPGPRGALPYVQLHRARITREMALGAEEAQYETLVRDRAGADEADGRLHRAPRLGQHIRGLGRARPRASSS